MLSINLLWMSFLQLSPELNGDTRVPGLFFLRLSLSCHPGALQTECSPVIQSAAQFPLWHLMRASLYPQVWFRIRGVIKGKKGGTFVQINQPVTTEWLTTECKSCYLLSHFMFLLTSVPVAHPFNSAICMEDMRTIIVNEDKILPRFLSISV
jgi:hypothetical protein